MTITIVTMETQCRWLSTGQYGHLGTLSVVEREEEFMLRKKHDPRGELFGREPEPVVSGQCPAIPAQSQVILNHLALYIYILKASCAEDEFRKGCRNYRNNNNYY